MGGGGGGCCGGGGGGGGGGSHRVKHRVLTSLACRYPGRVLLKVTFFFGEQ